MADEIVRGGRFGADNDGGDVPALAGDVEDWGLVSFNGILGADRTVLRYGYFPTDTVLRDCVYGTAWLMALSKSF